ncbi:metallophosphoesterase [Pseudenhygromyxa sp. WMMC2535]|uniref:metallophosphoesterase n=1 Tax=Pseudenhygromyxa sp. WMMC2535 TaxID=2712867 RepID=UPI001557F28A|nr:metallophosphoesterase [Pseudenhygromyxa sp. WMMC2535]NVB39213.1 metallophosphoesterase [Pseudenhygromyxa sp. WMMC2535]
MDLPRVLFFIVFLSAWGALHWLVGRRLNAHGSERPAWMQRLIWAAVSVLALLPLLAFYGRRTHMAGAELEVVQWLGFLCMGVSSLLISFTLAVEVPRLIARVGLAARKRLRARRSSTTDTSADTAAPPTEAELLSPQRRRFFADVANYGIVGGAAGLSVAGFAIARRVPRVVEVHVPVPDLHPDLEGLRIVQLSDVHVGPTIRGTWLDRVVEVVNAQGADLVALTGDFVDGFVDDLSAELAGLGRIQSTYGSFFVTGNHEYYWDGPAWCRAIAGLGPTVLCNEHRVIERGAARLLVAGVTDLHAERNEPSHRSDPARAKADAPAHDFSLLLAHQPRSVYAASAAGFDLQLSGHTHAGQYFPMSVLIYALQPYVSGLNRHEDMQIYVSQGTGYWGPPNRAGAAPEISLLILERA